jgi:hypothetical protein
MKKNWKEFPHIVALAGALQEWKDEFKIIEFIRADESGNDQSGRLEGGSDKPNFEIAKEFCWTHFTSDGQEWIEAGVKIGDWGSGGVYGWFIGENQWGSQAITLQTHAFACSVCEGNYTYEGQNGEDMDCEACLEEDADFINLVDILKI